MRLLGFGLVVAELIVVLNWGDELKRLVPTRNEGVTKAPG